MVHTSTVDAQTSSTIVALCGSFLAAAPQATSATSSTKKKKRHKEDAQAMKKKKQEADPKEEEAEAQTRGGRERGFILKKKLMKDMSYPNFVRGLLLDDMQPLIDRFKILGTLCCIICKSRDAPEVKRKQGYAIHENP